MARALPRNGDEREDRAALIAAMVTHVFAVAEQALIAAIAAAVRRAIANPGSAVVSGGRLERQSGAVLAVAERRAEQLVARAGLDPVPGPVEEILKRGVDTAYQSVSRAYTQAVQAALSAVESPSVDTGQIYRLGERTVRPVRLGRNAYREAVQAAIEDTRGGLPSSSVSLSRIQVAQKALDDLAGQGIAGFTDKAGREWDLASYVEMATRTAVSNAYDDHLAAALTAGGVDLVLVGTHSTEGSCPACLPFLGHVLSLGGGTTGAVSIRDATATEHQGVVMCSLAEAKARGFRHPNCRCDLLPYHDGADITQDAQFAVSPEQAAADYAASQRTRALERRVRAAGRLHQAAITPRAKATARRDLAAARKASAEHRAAHGVRQTQVGVRRREHPFRAH